MILFIWEPVRSPLAKEGMFTHAAAKKSMKKLGAKKSNGAKKEWAGS